MIYSGKSVYATGRKSAKNWFNRYNASVKSQYITYLFKKKEKKKNKNKLALFFGRAACLLINNVGGFFSLANESIWL